MKVVAYANDTTVMINWLPDTKIPNCLGFAIKRTDKGDGSVKILTSQRPFEGQSNPTWTAQPTTVWPIQQFTWMDFTPQLEHSYEYEVVPMVGTPDNLQELTAQAGKSNTVKVTTQLSQCIAASFNRGILSTQWLAHHGPKDAEGKLDLEALLKAVLTPGDPLREQLAGHIIEFLQQPVKVAAEEGGHVYGAFYELTDRQMIDFWKQHADVWTMLLANTGKDPITKQPDAENAPFRQELHDAGCDVIDRMIANSYGIGHNKTQCRCDKTGKPVEVTSSSANITGPGFCGQANNALRILSEAVAALFYEYWQQLKKDTQAGSKQGAELRAWCATPRGDITLPDGSVVTVLFSPETATTEKPKDNQPPLTMARIFRHMHRAKHAIYGAWFYPGFPSVVSEVQWMYKTRPELMFKCVLSSAQALGRDPITPRPGEPPVIVVAEGIEQDFADYVQEALLLPDAHAIIHSKVLVIDPLSDYCVVIMGSHNMGYKASTVNDENVIIVRGNRALAAAYMIHILDLYNHYLFRQRVNHGDPSVHVKLAVTDEWQDPLFTGFALKEIRYWTGVLEEADGGVMPHIELDGFDSGEFEHLSEMTDPFVVLPDDGKDGGTKGGGSNNGGAGTNADAAKPKSAPSCDTTGDKLIGLWVLLSVIAVVASLFAGSWPALVASLLSTGASVVTAALSMGRRVW
jgi:hypothetical protein